MRLFLIFFSVGLGFLIYGRYTAIPTMVIPKASRPAAPVLSLRLEGGTYPLEECPKTQARTFCGDYSPYLIKIRYISRLPGIDHPL